MRNASPIGTGYSLQKEWARILTICDIVSAKALLYEQKIADIWSCGSGRAYT